MPPGKVLIVTLTLKNSVLTVDDGIHLLSKGFYMAKVDLRHAYRSVSVHSSNWMALGLKWLFWPEILFLPCGLWTLGYLLVVTMHQVFFIA